MPLSYQMSHTGEELDDAIDFHLALEVTAEELNNLSSLSSTTDLPEGTNKYYTTQRVADLVANSSSVTWDYNAGTPSLTPTVSLSPFTTTQLAEGTNLYYTNTRADSRISNAIGVSVQAYDADLTGIGALAPTNDDFIQRKAGEWANRTVAQVKTDLAVSNVDNTSDINKPISTAVQTALNLKQDSGNYITALTGDVTASGPGSVAATIAANAVSNSKLATIATASIKGRITLGSGDVEDLTGVQTTTLLSNFVGDSGSGGSKGLVPAPSPGDAAKFLKADGSWTTIDHGVLTGLSDDDHSQYHTDSRASTWIGTKSTSDLPEGTNKYYTDVRADGRISAAIGVSVQAYDADLSTIGALAPTNDDFIQRKAGEWSNRTISQVKTDLSLSGANTGDETTATIKTKLGAATTSLDGYLTSTDWTSFNLKESAISAGTTAQYYRGDKSFQTLDKTAVGLANVDNTSDANKPISSATQTALNAKQDSGNYITALTGDVTATGPGAVAATIAANAVNNSKLATVATATIKGRVTASTGDVEDLTGSQATTLLSNFVGDTGTGGAKGLVPAPITGDATKYLKGDSTWSAIDHGDLTGLADDDHTQYHNDARALTWLGTRSTSDVTEGTNLYYTNTRADDRIAAAVGASIQAYDADLTTIGGLSPTNDDFIQRKAGVWANRTIAQVKTDLSLSGSNTGDQTTVSGNAGTATALETSRFIYGNSFDGTSSLAQIIASTYGGTGNGFTKFTGPTTSERTFTLPNSTCTILTSNAAVTVAQGGTGQTTYTNGQLLIGNTTGNTLTKATLTGTSNQVIVTNSTGSITLSTPQNIHTTAVPTFANAILTDLTPSYLTVVASDEKLGNSIIYQGTVFDGTGIGIGGTDLRGVLTVQKNFTTAYAANTDPGDTARVFVMQNNSTTGGVNQYSNITLQLYPTGNFSGSGRCLADFRLVRETANNSNCYFMFSGFREGASYKDYFKIGFDTSYLISNLFAGGATTATAKVHIGAGSATASTAPLKFTSGTNLTTGETGAVEYNGTNLFFTRSGTTRETVWCGNSGATAPSTTSIGVIVDYYGTSNSRVLTTPNSWASVVIGGTTYKLPLYT